MKGQVLAIVVVLAAILGVGFGGVAQLSMMSVPTSYQDGSTASGAYSFVVAVNSPAGVPQSVPSGPVVLVVG
jgi:hypothetical protein